jgi:hypothetical protein
MPKLDVLPPETTPAFFGQPSQQIDLWFTNIGCAEFRERSSDPLAPWCIPKDVVFFFVSHDQENNILGLSNPNLLQLWEATHEIPPSAFATCRSENLECQTQADQKSPSRESGKKHSSGWQFPMPATSQSLSTQLPSPGVTCCLRPAPA